MLPKLSTPKYILARKIRRKMINNYDGSVPINFKSMSLRAPGIICFKCENFYYYFLENIFCWIEICE